MCVTIYYLIIIQSCKSSNSNLHFVTAARAHK